jgi:hypothetical protein
VPILGAAEVEAKVGGRSMKVNGYVTEHVADLILGIDFLAEHEILWNFPTDSVTVGGQELKLQTRSLSKE